MSGNVNGNRLKGNAVKKANRVRKKTITSFDKTVDQYAMVDKMVGGHHLEAKTLKNRTPIIIRIPGRFYKRVWFNRGDLLIITQVAENIMEIKGKPSEEELPKIRYQFDKQGRANGDTKNIIHFGDYDESDEENEDDKDDKDEKDEKNNTTIYRKPIPKDINKNQHKGMARTIRETGETPTGQKEPLSSDEPLNIDDI